MKSAVQLRRTDKSATVQLRQTQADRKDIRYLYNRWYFHQTDSNQSIQATHRATGSPINDNYPISPYPPSVRLVSALLNAL